MGHQTNGSQIHLLLLAGIVSLGVAHGAKALVATGPDDELFVTGTASAQENDNLFLSHSNQKTDTVFDLIPGVEYDFGKNSVTKGSFTASEDFQMFGSESNLDTGLPSAAFNGGFDDTKSKLNFSASFQQADQATRDVRQVGVLVKRDLYHVEGQGETQLTDKTSLGAGAIYDDTHYQAASYTDWRWVKVPLKYYYDFEPKLALSGGFTFTNNSLGTGGIDSNEYFYNVGARGEFTPKLTGEFSVGYEQIAYDKGGSRNGLGAASSFTYAYSPKTSFTAGVSNDFGYSAAGGSSYRIFGLNCGFTSALSEQWSATGQLNYSRYNYITTPQKDDFYNARLSANYALNTHVSLIGAYSYGEDSSNLSANSFTNNIFSISATVRY